MVKMVKMKIKILQATLYGCSNSFIDFSKKIGKKQMPSRLTLKLASCIHRFRRFNML